MGKWLILCTFRIHPARNFSHTLCKFGYSPLKKLCTSLLLFLCIFDLYPQNGNSMRIGNICISGFVTLSSITNNMDPLFGTPYLQRGSAYLLLLCTFLKPRYKNSSNTRMFCCCWVSRRCLSILSIILRSHE